MTEPFSTPQELHDNIHVGQSIYKEGYGFDYAIITEKELRSNGVYITYKRYHDRTIGTRAISCSNLTSKTINNILLIGCIGWLPRIVMGEIEESCITCISQCKKDEMCAFYRSLVEGRE